MAVFIFLDHESVIPKLNNIESLGLYLFPIFFIWRHDLDHTSLASCLNLTSKSTCFIKPKILLWKFFSFAAWWNPLPQFLTQYSKTCFKLKFIPAQRVKSSNFSNFWKYLPKWHRHLGMTSLTGSWFPPFTRQHWHQGKSCSWSDPYIESHFDFDFFDYYFLPTWSLSRSI